MDLRDHPTVKRRLMQEARLDSTTSNRVVETQWLRQLALDCGADDAGLVEVGRRDLDAQRAEILRHYPWTRILLSFVVRMTREPIRSPARSVANLEFHHAGDRVDDVGRLIVLRLEEAGIRAVNPSMGFPMEMNQFPGYGVWVVSHKPVAVAAGLGHMGIHRNVIHPKFGNFILLGTVLIDADVAQFTAPIDYNPCLECKLCVAVCPVSAISPDGGFNFSACFTHNYREFMGGFTDWVEQVADSRNALDYRNWISEPETASMWQSLSHGANYKSAYCMAVCPAGEDVIGPYLQDRRRHIQEVVKPLQEKSEPVYVIKGSDAEGYARKKWKNKSVKHVGNTLRPRSIDALLKFIPIVFQSNQSRGLNATFHFRFTGEERRDATIVIQDRKVRVSDGHIGSAALSVTADSRTWLGFLAKERNPAWAFLRGKIRIKGSPRLLLAFGKCFPTAGFRHDRAEVVSQPSRLRPEPSPYRRNDTATGRIRWTGTLQVTEIIEETYNVKTFRLANPGGGKMPFDYLPGQFLTLDIDPGSVPVTRSYTIASAPGLQDWMEITVKREDHGLVSRWLHDVLKPGDCVKVLAPSGTFTFTGEEAEGIVLVGGGVGCTPLMSIVRSLSGRQWAGAVHLILSFRKPSDFLFREEIAALQSRNRHLQVTVTVTDQQDEPWLGLSGRIDKALLRNLFPDLPARRVHLCGPPAMMDSVRSALIELGVPEGRCKTEAFGTIKRNPTMKAAKKPVLAGHVTFLNSQVTLPVPEGATLLDVADEADIHIDNACRSGTCGACRVKLVSGRVRMPVEDALTDDEKADGEILACQAEVEGDIEVEA
jgi:ferredoxin-NADP reductase/putative sterol carrier protein/NAD-dependent dihydropyrimidine dehydrogenase PreA subunit